VSVQLINALTDTHLWADTYDRKLIDIFSVESEIAKDNCRHLLQAKLSGQEQRAIATRPTENPEAYSSISKAAFSGTNVPPPICGSPSTTLIRHSLKILITRSPMPVLRKHGCYSRLQWRATADCYPQAASPRGRRLSR